MHSWVVVAAKHGRTIPPDVVEMLDHRMADDLPFPVMGHEQWSSDDGRVRAGGWWAEAASPGIGAFWQRSPGDVTAFSGHVWIDDAPWPATGSWAAQLGGRCASLDISRDVERLSGDFTLLHLRSDGSGWVTADPLGVGPLYRAETPDVVVVANRAELAATLTCAPGALVARDVEAMGLLAYTGSLQGLRTGFEAVRVLPQGSILHLHPHRDPRVETWAPMPWWDDDAPGDLDGAVELCLDRLRARVRLLASPVAARATCELTGGKDSRLVLALLLAEGLAHDVEFRTWGTPEAPDVAVATMLAERYGLDHRVGGKPVVSRTGYRPQRPPARDQGGWRKRAVDYEGQLRHHVWAGSGALSIWDLHTFTWPPASGLTLSGVAGEMLRTNYSATDRIETTDLLARFLTRGGFGFDAAGLLTNDAADHVRHLVMEQIQSVLPTGGDARDAVDGFYLRGLLRRWAGAHAELGTRHRVFSLYDLHAIRAAFAIGSEARRSEVLHLRLIEACAPGLARMPFADTGWSDQLVRSRPDGASLPQQAGRRQLPISAELALLPVRRRLHRSRRGFVIDLARRRRPKAGAAETNRMQNIEHKRAVLRSLLDLPPGHPTWDLYDRRRTLDALDRIETLPTQGRADVHHAATVATWLDRGEQRADLFTPTAD